MYRSRTCGELRLEHAGEEVTLAGWVQRSRKMGGMTFIDLRDRYGITQLVFDESSDAELCGRANKLGREFVIQIVGTVNERYAKNDKMPTGEIEIIVKKLNILNASEVPPFTIEEDTDGGDDLRSLKLKEPAPGVVSRRNILGKLAVRTRRRSNRRLEASPEDLLSVSFICSVRVSHPKYTSPFFMLRPYPVKEL